jgi:hypothetical protein
VHIRQNELTENSLASEEDLFRLREILPTETVSPHWIEFASGDARTWLERTPSSIATGARSSCSLLASEVLSRLYRQLYRFNSNLLRLRV